MQYTLKQISQHLDAKVINEPSGEVIISGLNYAEQAKENDLTLIDKQEHIKLWQNSVAAAIVSKKISDELAQVNVKPLIVVNNADLAMAKILEPLYHTQNKTVSMKKL